uniref:Uncharacterized protein n=1 Tax=Nicotiana tabacum TaxID=4097 RepID=A0A1S3Y3J7_TOBAC|nr:PREDICTED: uncharacterized protein LOC107771781 [Nicotiana tabacum]XP_016446711.1 PREDICTED: uncharacterized protein LOC107771781 [Nicotiana tabacum]XP_016446712.1 PREDICTED: uncharacterized protein LOC107771781 [Nicotiana tabacum]
MRTRGCNRLVIEQDDDEYVRPYIEHLMDAQNHSAGQPYIDQLMDNRNNSEDHAHDDQSNELNNSVGGTEVQHNDDESGNQENQQSQGGPQNINIQVPTPQDSPRQSREGTPDGSQINEYAQFENAEVVDEAL